MFILVTKKKKWFWRLIADNHKTLLTSETYFSKWNAVRAARKLAVTNEIEMRVAK